MPQNQYRFLIGRDKDRDTDTFWTEIVSGDTSLVVQWLRIHTTYAWGMG